MAAGEETEPNYLSVAQVARRLGCSVSLVQKWRRLGWLPAARLGPPEVPVYGYLGGDVDRFAAERWNRRRGRPPGKVAPLVPRAPAVIPPGGQIPPPPPAVATAPPAPAPALAPASPRPAPPAPPPVVARPLALWDADPRLGAAIVLARFRPAELDYALSVAAAWAPRYDTLALGEAATPSAPELIVALWRAGRRVAE